MTDLFIGGYFSLELNDGGERYADAIKLNAGRYALEFILRGRKYRKVLLPYYICDSVLQPLVRLNIAYEFYHINEQLEPASKLYIREDEAVLYVNYFGLKNRFVDSFCLAFRNTILDNTQAFYSEPGNKVYENAIQCDTFYSCRKFFGVSDGAYLYTNCDIGQDLPQDESFERMTFLTKRIDRSPMDGYADFRANDKAFSNVGMRRMSRLTESIMQGIDYEEKANRRIQNFKLLDDALRNINYFKWDIAPGTIPMVYPLYVKNGAELRQKLIDNHVFCARYWPNVLEWCRSSDWEYQLSENLICLPIDQRYGMKEMERIIDLIKGLSLSLNLDLGL